MGKFATFIIGGLVGATAALMLSPRTGVESRKVVVDKFNESCPIAGDVQGKAGSLLIALLQPQQKLSIPLLIRGRISTTTQLVLKQLRLLPLKFLQKKR